MSTPYFTWDHILYRFYGSDDTLFYVGITNSLRTRFKAHARQQPWWPDVVDCRIEFKRDRTALALAEYEAIRDEHPLYNIRRGAPRRAAPVTVPITVPRPGSFRAGFTDDERAWMHMLGKYRANRCTRRPEVPAYPATGYFDDCLLDPATGYFDDCLLDPS